jgi:hypothetical protein
MTLGPFPTDETALDQIKHALGGAFTVDEDGTHHLQGADFTLNQLMEFYSGYDPEDSYQDGYIGDVPLFIHTEPMYHYHDVIRALIDEIERLRAEQKPDDIVL